MINFDKNRFLVGFGAKYLERHLEDDQFWSDLLRKNVNPKLAELNPILLVEYFEKNMEFDKIFGHGDIDRIHEMVEGNEDLLVKLKQKAELNLRSFEWNWIEDWFKKDHQEILGVIINHPRSEEFKKYLTDQIAKLSKNITESI